MRTIDTNELVLKSWRIQCRTAEQATRIAATCQNNHTHAPVIGGDRVTATSYYPLPMVKRWMKGVMRPRNMETLCTRLCAIDQEAESETETDLVGGVTEVRKHQLKKKKEQQALKEKLKTSEPDADPEKLRDKAEEDRVQTMLL